MGANSHLWIKGSLRRRIQGIAANSQTAVNMMTRSKQIYWFYMVHSRTRRLCDFSTLASWKTKQSKTNKTKQKTPKSRTHLREIEAVRPIYPCVLPSPQTRVRQVVRKSLLVNVFVFVLYLLRRFTTCHFSGNPVCTDGVRVNLHFPSGAQRWYLFSLTRPLQAIHQGVSKLSSCYFLLRVWKEMARWSRVCYSHDNLSVWPLSAGGFPLFVTNKREKPNRTNKSLQRKKRNEKSRRRETRKKNM